MHLLKLDSMVDLHSIQSLPLLAKMDHCFLNLFLVKENRLGMVNLARK